jgi:hypothetical protein
MESNKYGIDKPYFALRYGDYKGTIHLDEQIGMFGGYAVRWTVFTPKGGAGIPIYSGICEISQRQLQNAAMTGKRLTEQTLLKLLKPATDHVQFAMFCCVVEKFVCD